jgi:hypothetical protein
MNPQGSCRVPELARAAVAGGLLLGLAACLGPDLDAPVDPIVAGGGTPASPERVAAVAEMRQRGNAAEELPYPDAFQADQTRRLAARAEPPTATDFAAIQAELEAIALLQQSATTPEEIAELQMRATALRRTLDEQAGKVQR